MSQKAAVVIENPTKGNYIKVDTIPITEPRDDQILIKAKAYALNPTDWKHIISRTSEPGAIAGSDAAGVVEKVGKNVKGFAVGDHASTFMHGNFFKERGALVEHVVGDPNTTIKYSPLKEGSLEVGTSPSSTIKTFEAAASVTLGLATVVLSFVGNFNIKPEDKGKYILIWGGATATGILAIQVAKQSFGLKVATVSSPKNFGFLKSLGADVVVDYHQSDAIEQLKEATAGEITYALDAVSNDETWQQVYDATYESDFVKLDSLRIRKYSELKVDDRKGKVEVVEPTLVYLVDGNDTTIFNTLFKPPPKETLDRYNAFWFNELPKLIPNLRHANLKVLEPGLESFNKGAALLQDDKLSGEKVVFRA